MLKLIETEFLKLRRKKMIWFMLLAALIMPVMAFLLFKYRGDTGVDPIQFYKWSAFGYTLFIFLPVVLGILCTMLIHEEKQNDVLKQLWIVPVSKAKYLFSKFFVVLFYSVGFMMITAFASVLFSVLPGYVAFDWGSILYLLERCFEIGVLTAFAMLPILAIASSRKGYILPVCVTLVYAFCGFIFMSLNMYMLPLTSMAVIVMRNKDIPRIVFPQAINIPLAFLCICTWDIAAVLFAKITLKRE